MYRVRKQKKLQLHHIKFAVLNKTDNKITVYHKQREVAELIGVHRKTIQRMVAKEEPYSRDNYTVYLIKDVKY